MLPVPLVVAFEFFPLIVGDTSGSARSCGRIMQLRGVNTLEPDCDPAFAVEGSLGCRPYHLRPFENVSGSERGAGVRLKPKCVWPGLDNDFRGVSVGLSFRPELARVNRTCYF